MKVIFCLQISSEVSGGKIEARGAQNTNYWTSNCRLVRYVVGCQLEDISPQLFSSESYNFAMRCVTGELETKSLLKYFHMTSCGKV